MGKASPQRKGRPRITRRFERLTKAGGISKLAFLTACLFAVINLQLVRKWPSQSPDNDTALVYPESENRALTDNSRRSHKATTRRPKKNITRSPPIGTLNGYDLYVVDQPPRTRIHCAGDTFQDRVAWPFRSCEYKLMCFDTSISNFVLYEQDLSSDLPDGWYSSTLRDTDPSKNIEVNAKSRNTRIVDDGTGDAPNGLFYPQILSKPPPPSYFYLDVAMIPFFRYHIGFRNPGHLMWQDLVSLYKLLDMFGREDEELLLVPLRSEIGKAYYREGNADLMNKLGSKLMGMPSYTEYNPYWEDGDLTINITSPEFKQRGDTPTVVCTKYGLTGMGEFGYHETHHQNTTHEKWKGRLNWVLEPAHHGSGGFFRRFRKFMMRNVQVEDPEELVTDPSTIVFSQNSSGRGARANNAFELQMKYLQDTYPTSEVQVKGVTLSKLNVQEQVRLMTQTRVFATATGGGTATALFLPPGAHLILFYETWFLDWDYWNNMPDIHVHWIPIEHMQDPAYLHNFKLLIDECLGLTEKPQALNFTHRAPPPVLPEREKNLTSLGLCKGYDGILYISQVFKKAATGTFFFQSIVDSLLYAEEHNLYPFIYVDKVSEQQPCYDERVHGDALNGTYYHVGGHIENVFRHTDRGECINEPGAPSSKRLEEVEIRLLGNGIWQTYFQPRPIPFNDDSCQDKPVYEMALSQILPGMHYCSEGAVRGWVYPRMAKELKPEARNQTLHEWLTDNRKRASRMVHKHFFLQPWLSERIEANNPVAKGGKCLGVHIRLTDKGSGRKKLDIDAYLPYLDAYVEKVQSKGERPVIYLATDDARVLDRLLKASSVLKPTMLRHQSGTLLSSSETATFTEFQSERHRVNTETLIDIYGLSQCSYLIHGYSAVAEAAIYIHPELNDFSINIDDDDATTPLDFGRFVEETYDNKATQ